MNNQKGNALIGSMIAIMLLGMTMLAFTKLVSLMNLQQHTMQINSQAQALTNSIMLNGCANTDGTIDLNGNTLLGNLDMVEYGVTILSISSTSVQYKSMTPILGGQVMKEALLAVKPCVTAPVVTVPPVTAPPVTVNPPTEDPDNSAQNYCLTHGNHWINGECVMHETGDGCGR